MNERKWKKASNMLIDKKRQLGKDILGMMTKQVEITSTVGSTIGNPPFSHRHTWGWGVFAALALSTCHAIVQNTSVLGSEQQIFAK